MENKTSKSARLVDDRQYWKKRHAKTSSLRASGQKSVGVRSNEYIYKILAEQYLRLLNEIDLKGLNSVLDCGFGDGIFLNFYKTNFPQLDIYGVDISQAAKKKVDFVPKDKLFVSEIAKFNPKRKFDIVHSFDVLYHILKDDDYVNSLNNMAKLSNKYIILHERFLDRPPLISSKHVYMRAASFTDQVLNANGFYVKYKIPTHFLALRMLTYKLNKIIPATLCKLDQYIANNAHPSTQEALASHYIMVYTRSSNQ